MSFYFELYEGNVEDLPPGYQEVSCHILFDANMGDNFRRKSRMVEVGHKTTTPPSLDYLSVVSWEIVRIALTVAALNDLKVLACDIHNGYLTSKYWEKIWTVAGPEFGPEQGKVVIVVRALYGLKYSGANIWALLAEQLHDWGYKP